MDPIRNRIGNYHYADGWIQHLRFRSGHRTRKFTVVIASAYNALGLIGSEGNGIVVFNLDNRSVVLDEHTKIGTGWFGPSQSQQLEFRRLCRMGWTEFRDFCKSNARYREGSVT